MNVNLLTKRTKILVIMLGRHIKHDVTKKIRTATIARHPIIMPIATGFPSFNSLLTSEFPTDVKVTIGIMIPAPYNWKIRSNGRRMY